MTGRRVPLEIRFWEKVNKTDDCWLWTASVCGRGYADIKVDGRMVKAHRIAYEWARGPIPDGLDIDHLCRVRHCVNPDHMEPVTRRENTLRGIGPSAKRSRQTHCKHGHEFTPENTYLWRTSRHCRTCQEARRQKAS